MKFEFSAGGVVVKKDAETHTMSVLLAQHAGHHGWIFPKGHIGDHHEKETKEEAALREVLEETGITGEIRKPLAPATYWFVKDQVKIKKTVYYFLMQYVSGDTTIRDHEMENVEWVPMDKVAERLTYESDKQVWEEAKKLIEK